MSGQQLANQDGDDGPGGPGRSYERAVSLPQDMSGLPRRWSVDAGADGALLPDGARRGARLRCVAALIGFFPKFCGHLHWNITAGVKADCLWSAKCSDRGAAAAVTRALLLRRSVLCAARSGAQRRAQREHAVPKVASACRVCGGGKVGEARFSLGWRPLTGCRSVVLSLYSECVWRRAVGFKVCTCKLHHEHSVIRSPCKRHMWLPCILLVCTLLVCECRRSLLRLPLVW